MAKRLIVDTVRTEPVMDVPAGLDGRHNSVSPGTGINQDEATDVSEVKNYSISKSVNCLKKDKENDTDMRLAQGDVENNTESHRSHTSNLGHRKLWSAPTEYLDDVERTLKEHAVHVSDIDSDLGEGACGSSLTLQENILFLDLDKDFFNLDTDDGNSSQTSSKDSHEVVNTLTDSKSQAQRTRAAPCRRYSRDNSWQYVSSHDQGMLTVENIAGSPKVSFQCNLCEGLELTLNRDSCEKSSICDNRSDGAQSDSIISFAQLSSMVSANTDSVNEYTNDIWRTTHEDVCDDCLDLSYLKPVVPLDPPIRYSCHYATNSCSISLGDLPAELVLKILGYFSPRELCQCVAPVCKRWYQLAYDPVFWRKLDLGNSAVTASSVTLCRILSRAPYLHQLSLRGRSCLTLCEVSTFTQFCLQLRVLDLGFCDSVSYSIVETLVKNCRELDDVNVEGCTQIDHKCIKLFVTLPKLKHLNLSHCNLLSDESVLWIASSLRTVESLNIDGISWIYDESILHLVSHHKSNLRQLKIDGADLSNSSFEAISECSQLAKLSVSFAELLTDAALQHILKLNKLEHLRLRKGSEFTSFGLRSMFECNILKNLRLLDLTECSQLEDNGVLALAQCCGATLGYLALSWCWNITDIGLISIMDHCCNLSHLDLLGIDKITGVCLDRIPEAMPSLSFLDLRNCNRIVDDLIMDVVRRKPDLIVLNYYGEQFVD